jgi:hypothetical protein
MTYLAGGRAITFHANLPLWRLSRADGETGHPGGLQISFRCRPVSLALHSHRACAAAAVEVNPQVTRIVR